LNDVGATAPAIPEQSLLHRERFLSEEFFMRFVVCACMLSAVLAIGCSGPKQPEADPNFQPTTNPSDITIPDQMKQNAPGGG
jgi:hypothetical protein